MTTVGKKLDTEKAKVGEGVLRGGGATQGRGGEGGTQSDQKWCFAFMFSVCVCVHATYSLEAQTLLVAMVSSISTNVVFF